MPGINLLPAVERHKRRIDQLNYFTLIGGIVTVVGALALSGFLIAIDQIYRVNLEGLRSQRAQAVGQSALYLNTEKKADDLAGQLANLKKAQNQTTHWSSILTELQILTPPAVSVKSLSIKSNAGGQPSQKAQITGLADSRRSLGEFQVALTRSPYLKNIDISTSNLIGSGTAVDYQITLDVNFDKLNGPVK